MWLIDLVKGVNLCEFAGICGNLLTVLLKMTQWKNRYILFIKRGELVQWYNGVNLITLFLEMEDQCRNGMILSTMCGGLTKWNDGVYLHPVFLEMV